MLPYVLNIGIPLYQKKNSEKFGDIDLVLRVKIVSRFYILLPDVQAKIFLPILTGI
jgi:hypothetical protein